MEKPVIWNAVLTFSLPCPTATCMVAGATSKTFPPPEYLGTSEYVPQAHDGNEKRPLASVTAEQRAPPVLAALAEEPGPHATWSAVTVSENRSTWTSITGLPSKSTEPDTS